MLRKLLDIVLFAAVMLWVHGAAYAQSIPGQAPLMMSGAPSLALPPQLTIIGDQPGTYVYCTSCGPSGKPVVFCNASAGTDLAEVVGLNETYASFFPGQNPGSLVVNPTNGLPTELQVGSGGLPSPYSCSNLAAHYPSCSIANMNGCPLLTAQLFGVKTPGPSRAWALNNSVSAYNAGPANTLSASINVANTGDLVVITVGGNYSQYTGTLASGFAITAATVGATTCTSISGANTTGSNNLGLSMWKCEGVAAGNSQSVTITVSYSMWYLNASVSDWSGARASNSSEGGNNVSDGGSTNFSSPQSVTTSGTITNGDLVISTFMNAGGTSGFTPGTCCTAIPSGGEYQIANSNSATNSWTYTGSSQFAQVIAAFRH